MDIVDIEVISSNKIIQKNKSFIIDSLNIPEYDDSEESEVSTSKNVEVSKDDMYSSLSLFIMFLVLIFYSFNILFCMYNLYDTSYNEIDRRCPDTYIWIYLIYTTFVLNFIYYITGKIYNELENKHNFLYVLLFLSTISFMSAGAGYYVTRDYCVLYNFDNFYTITYYQMLLQSGIGSGSLISIPIMKRLKYI